MKLTFVLFAVVGLACGKSVPVPLTLEDDLQDFLSLVPLDEATDILVDYLYNDAEVQAAVAYLMSEDFKGIVLTMDSLPEYISFLNYLQASGLDVYKYINEIHEDLGLPHLPVPSARHSVRRGQGIKGLVDDLIAIMPREQLRALFQEKLQNSPDFRNLVERIRSNEFQSIIKTLVSLPAYQELKQKLQEKGVDVDAIIEFIKNLFGVAKVVAVRYTFTLEDDLADFINLIPADEALAILMDYVSNDAEVQAALEYLDTEEFKGIVLAIDDLPEYIKFLNYLQASGLDVYKYVNAVHDQIGLPHLPVPGTWRSARRGQGIKGLVDDMIAIMPREQLRALFQEKLQNSPDFRNLVERIRSNEFQSIIKTLSELPAYQGLKQKLIEKGLDVNAIVKFIKNLFGVAK